MLVKKKKEYSKFSCFTYITILCKTKQSALVIKEIQVSQMWKLF